MNIRIIAVGRIKEQYIKDIIKEYKKRLSGFCSFTVVEVTAEQIIEEGLKEKYKEAEAQRIIQVLKPNSYIITLEINGKMLSSEDFALKIKQISNEGINDITFIIGGANGLSSSVSARADYKLSFSRMTFTHQMVRAILIEQIYRAFKINANEPYHR